MDKDEREDKNRDSPTLSETKRSRHKVLFAQLRTFLHTHGYPEKEGGKKALHSTTDLSQKKEEEGNPESSEAVPNFAPSFHSYDDFHLKILQSVGTFIIILSTDGVIIYATENVSPLLGYTIDEIVGKKLLSLLPEEEKRDVFQKICLKLPVSNSVGRRMEFCCHLKRGNLQDDDKITYEHSKFFLCLKDVTDEPLEFLTRFFPSPKYVESSTTELPLEDRFYMVGTVCILNTKTLWEHLTVKDTSQDSQIIEISDDENSLTKGQMEPLCSASTGSASCDVDTEQYESQESARTSGDISLTSPETTRSSTTTSSQNLEYEPPVEEGHTTVEVEPVQRMEEMEEEVKQLDKPLRVSSPIAAYINKREKELVIRFKRKLEEKTQMLRADIRKQRKELKLMKEQLNTLKDSKLQMQPTMPYYISSDESQALEPAPKKQRTEQMEKSFTDTSETKSFHALCPPRSIRFSELFKEPGPFGPSTQIQSTDAPLQLAAEKQDKNIESQEEESQSFVPEDQQKQDMSPLRYSTDSDVLPASSSPSPVSSDSDISSLETTQDYIRLWHKTSDPNSHIRYEVRSWPCTDQDQGDGSEQELSPGEETQETSGPQAFQDTADDPSEKVSAYLSSDQSESDE